MEDISLPVAEKRRRGRPKGTKNTTAKKKRIPEIQTSIECVDTRNNHEMETDQNSTFNGFTHMKVKRVSNRTDERLTMLQIHERRLAHVQSASDMDSSDIAYTVASVKHLQKRNNDDNATMKGAMLQDYIMDCFSHDYQGKHANVIELHRRLHESNMNAFHTEEKCECGSSSLVVDTSTATQICTECGVCMHFQECTANDLWADERMQVLSKIAYKRINHFREWCNAIQARQQPNEALQTVINRVRHELKKERVVDMVSVTPQKIRNYLHTLRLGKYYEFTSAIYADITGKPIPKFTPDVEHTLMQMFTAIQPVFDEMEGKKRKNFLSYSYTLNKLAQIINLRDILEFFPLLKSREKLYAQDQMWRYICEKMNWTFHASI